MTKTYIDELAEEIARLREENKRLKEENRALAMGSFPLMIEGANKIEKLKELLKEWIHHYPIVLYEYEDTLKTKDIIELYDKTREVLK